MSIPVVPALLALWAIAVFATARPLAGLNPAALLSAWRPDRPADAFALANAAGTAWRFIAGHAGAGAVVAAILGLGGVILGLFPLGRRVPRPDRWAFSAGLGAGAAIFLFLGLGLCGLWCPSVGWTVALAGCWLACSRRGGSRPPLGATPRPNPEPLVSGAVRWMLAVFAAELVLALGTVAAGTVDRETLYDAQTYHLAMPMRFVADHRIAVLGYLLPSCMPMGGPMLYGWLMLLAGEPAARAWRAWLVAGACLLVWRMAAREGRPGAGLVAAALLAAFPLTLWIGPSNMPDFEAGALLLLAALAARAGREAARRSGWIALAGALIGAACAVKYQAVLFLPALLGSAVGWRPWRRPRAVAMGALFVLAALAPWWVRNAATIGNPFYPYAERLLPSIRPPLGYPEAEFLHAQRAFVVDGVRGLPNLPWRMSFGGRESVAPGPGLLVAVPLLFLLPMPPAARVYAAIAGVSMATWIGVSHNQRYWLATWALLLLAAALTAWESRRRSRATALVALGVLALPGAFGLARVLPAAGPKAASYALGRDTPAARWSRTTRNDWTGVAAAAGKRLSPRDRLLVIGEFRGVYWGRAVVSQNHEDGSLLEAILKSSRNAAEAAKRLRQVASCVYESDDEVARLEFEWRWPVLDLDSRERGIGAGVWSGWMDEVARDGAATIWRVRRTRAPRTGRVPLAFRREDFRRAYAPGAAIFWDGGGRRIE